MAQEEKPNVEKIQEQVVDAGKTIRDTSRGAVRGYIDAAFKLQRAGLDALGLFQNQLEKVTHRLVDRSEAVQDRLLTDINVRLQESINQLQDTREKGIETLNANLERLREAREQGTDNLQDNRGRLAELLDSSTVSLRDTLDRLRENASTVQTRLRLNRDELDEASDLTESRIREAAEIALKVARVLENRIETVIGELAELGRREWHEIEQRVDALVDRLDAELDDEITPIANYDDKTVEEVLSQLDGLDTVQLRAVRSHEASNKNRITLLRAIDEKLALTGPSIVERVEKNVSEAVDNVQDAVLPIRNYAEKNAEDAITALRNLNKEAELTALRVYEAATKNRVTVLRAIDERMNAVQEEA